MPTGKYGCIHYQWKPRKKCDNRLWKDENGKEHNHCQEHICIFCHGNVKSENKEKKQIGENNQGPLYYCAGKSNKNCIAKRDKIKDENKKVRDKLINNRDPLFDGLKANSLVDEEFLTELRPFFVDLWEKQIYLLDSNYFEAPVFTSDMLETIKGLIEGASFLVEREKNDLKLAYTKTGGNIDNTLSELEETLTNIGKAIKIKKDLEKAAKEQQKEAIERNNYSKNLENLDGWNLLGGNEKINYLQQIKSFPISSLDSVLRNAQETIKKIKEMNDYDREREREREREPKPREPSEPPTRAGKSGSTWFQISLPKNAWQSLW